MRLNSVKLLAAALAVALVVPVALAVASPRPVAASGYGVWEVGGGPTVGSKDFTGDDEGAVPAVSWSGKITPGLGPVVGVPGSAEVVCPGGNESISLSDVMGGANGTSFTLDVKKSALAGKCGRKLKVCYKTEPGEDHMACVYFAIPFQFTIPTIDYGGLVQLPLYQVELAVNVTDRFGEVNETYYGQVIITAHAGDGGVKLDGAWGQAVVEIEAGVGTVFVDASAVPSGGHVIFDLSGDRMDSSRSSIYVQ